MYSLFDGMAKERLIHKKEKPLSFDIGFPPSSNTNGITNNKATCWEARWRLCAWKNRLPSFEHNEGKLGNFQSLNSLIWQVYLFFSFFFLKNINKSSLISQAVVLCNKLDSFHFYPVKDFLAWLDVRFSYMQILYGTLEWWSMLTVRKYIIYHPFSWKILTVWLYNLAHVRNRAMLN